MSTEKLLNAVKNNSFQELLIYLSSGENVNIKDDENWTMLHYATVNDNLHMVKILLENGADRTLITNDGETPLHIASRKGYLEIVSRLLKHAASCSINYINNKTATHEETPLHIAAKNGFIDVVKSLLIHGAIYNLKNKQNETPLDLSKVEDVNKMLKLIYDCFEKAEKGDMELIKNLEVVSPDEFSAVINAQNCHNHSLIHVAMANNHHKLKVELLEIGRVRYSNLNTDTNRTITDNLSESPENAANKAKYELQDFRRFTKMNLRISNSHLLLLRGLPNGDEAVREGSFLLSASDTLLRRYRVYKPGKIEDENLKIICDTLAYLQFDLNHQSSREGTVYYNMLHDEGEDGVKRFIEILKKKLDTPAKKFLEKITQELEEMER